MSAVSIQLQGAQIASNLTAVESIVGGDEQDTLLLQRMSEDAKKYIASFPWCDAVVSSYFGSGVGGIFAVFLFHIRPKHADVDPWIWIIVGDIPLAYLPLTDCKSSGEAFRTYMRGMRNWVQLARKGSAGTPEQGVPPVDLPATPEWAERLNQRLNGLELAVRSFFEDESDAVN